eukprot:CAMPEP_0171325962 /NCGR_PEP_ID=MMETSP0816-20121228/117144_1 /TAXON_ID=420281 /ORGANISM="Proboscia inermis, Strain CCAP1064/1" /LENGTH=121 /DNA_ID=CAMNT_0011825283 /DNA_START=915 /DNA_END=1277 /DNA_ORIENTATION=+
MAGKLDINSTGLLLFKKNRMLAKKIIGPQSVILKVYHMRVAINHPGYDAASPQEFVTPKNVELLQRGGLILKTDDNNLKYGNANKRQQTANPNPNKDATSTSITSNNHPSAKPDTLIHTTK